MVEKDIQRGCVEGYEVICINEIKNIDRTTDEGKLLIMAITRLYLTVDKKLTLNEVLQNLKDTHKEIYG